jgi:diacylglycerol kinase family enzyme
LRAGVGADARLMASADRAAKDELGWMAYLRAALEQVAQDERMHYRLEADGAVHEFDALTVLALNIARLGRGGARLSVVTSPFDGALDLVVVRRGTLDAVASVVRRVVDGGSPLPPLLEREDREPEPVQFLRVREARLWAERDVELHIDGEVLPPLPKGVVLELGVLPGAVRVVAPALPE